MHALTCIYMHYRHRPLATGHPKMSDIAARQPPLLPLSPSPPAPKPQPLPFLPAIGDKHLLLLL